MNIVILNEYYALAQKLSFGRNTMFQHKYYNIAEMLYLERKI